MIECMLAAPSSGSGKTALACALLAALQKRGLAPCAFKCGPDYIDPMFHRSVLGVESHNLDLFLCGEDAARTLYARHAAGHGAAVVEGVMGFYDGVGGVTARASAWHVARTLDLPVLLVLRPRGASLTLAAQLEQSVDMPRLLALCGRRTADGAGRERKAPARKQVARIAVARDEAFCFAYAETLESLRDAGAELVFFSPVHDAALPGGAGGLYLPGGYPELYAGQLSQNAAMRRAVRRAVEAGLPTVAECGGFLYLGQSLEGEDGAVHPMAGALPGAGVRRQKLVRFGYAQLTARADSLLLRAGETVPVHEFHYWDSTENGAAFNAQKPATGRSWTCGFAGPALYAAFPHLYFAGRPQLAERFVRAAATFQSGR